MSTPHGRNRGLGNDDSSKKPTKALSLRNLRRRPNATITSGNGEHRSPDGEILQRSISLRGTRGFPKSLSPFVHLRDTTAIEAELDALNKAAARSNSPKPKIKKEADVENQELQDRTITYDRQNSMHASFLTNDSITDFNNSGHMFDESIILKNGEKTSDERPSAENVERSKSFRIESYDGANNDEIMNSDESRQTDTDSGEKDAAIDPNSFYAKFQKSRRVVGRLVNNSYVQITIILLIVLNGILIGMSTTNWVNSDRERVDVVRKIDLFFLIVFTIEIIMQLYYYAFALFRDAWLVFDLIVVIISWLAVGLPNDNSDFTVLRAFRIFRGARLVTRVKPLRDLVLALGEVLPRMYAIVGLLLVIFYVFAVLFTEQFSKVDLEYMGGVNYFGTLHDSFLSCFQMMTMEWVDICRPLMQEAGEKHAWISIVTFVMIAGFIVFNLIVAVVVEAVSQTEETVRHLDGIESNTPAAQLAEAEERIDLLTSHLNEMMEQQEQIQFMLETMAGELLHLETERMKAKYRENRLREEITRHIEKQNKEEEGEAEDKQPNEKQPNDAIKKISMQFLHRIEAQKAARKKEEEEAAAATPASSDPESITGGSVKKKKIRRNSMRSAMSRDGSGKSIGSFSGDSAQSLTDTIESPNQRSTVSRRKLDASSTRGVSLKVNKSSVTSKGSGREQSGSDDMTDRKKKAIGNWKKLLAVQKDFEL